MADEEFDAWQFSTGLPEKVRAKITDSYFTFDADYNDGQTLLLKLEIQSDDTEIGTNGADTFQYPCGPGWEPADKGARAKREDGTKKAFHVNSGVAVLCAGAVEAGAAEVLKSRGTPLDAGIWKGLEFTFHRKGFTFSNRENNEKVEYSRMVPVEFHGGGEGGKKAAGSTKKAASKPAAASKAEPEGEVDESTTTTGEGEGAGGLTEPQRVKLKILAKKSDTHNDFMEAAFEQYPDLMGNAEAEEAIADDGEGSIWQQAQG